MMIVFRMALLAVLLSNCAALSMESWQRNCLEDIDYILQAVDINDIEYIEKYIINGGDINLKGTIPANAYSKEIKGMTPLMASAFYGRPKLMKIFIKNGATLNRRNEFGDTALIMAARIHYTSLVKLLVKAGAQKNIRNNNGKTAFEEARDSLVRPFYSDCTCKHGSNHSFAEMTRLLTNREDRIRPSIHRKNNRNVAKNNNERTVVSLQYTDNTMQYYVPMVIAGHYPVLYIQQ